MGLEGNLSWAWAGGVKTSASVDRTRMANRFMAPLTLLFVMPHASGAPSNHRRRSEYRVVRCADDDGVRRPSAHSVTSIFTVSVMVFQFFISPASQVLASSRVGLGTMLKFCLWKASMTAGAFMAS